MSFLSGILNIGKSAVGLLSGNGFASSLAKTALLGYAVNRLSKNAIKDNNSGTDNIDKGVRLQVAPNAESKIPVLYGSAFFGGNISDAAMTNNNKTMWYSLVLAEKTGTVYSTTSASDYTFNNIYWNDQRIIFKSDGVTADYTVDRSGNIDRSLSGLVKVYCYKGGRTAGVVPSGYTGTVPNAETLFPNWASGTHAMTNLIFALVRVDYNRERNITGIGNMLFHVTNTMNLPGDCLYDYLTNATYGAKIASADIITADIASLNTYSAQSVNYDDQGTGAQTLADRYQINGLIDTANPVLENAEAILNAAASWLSYDAHEGKWGIVINKAGTSVASFNDSNILGDISLSGTGLQDLYNAVKVEFPHRNLRDSGDFVNIEIDSAERNGNEQDNTLNITYDIINEPIQAQLLGFIELKQSRVDKIIKFETDFSYYNLKAGDLIDVTNSRFSFSGKLFRIISINEMQDNESALIMEITALEYDSNVYSTADLYRYTRSDVNGIITIGSIGIPGTPAVTKFEVDSRPRVEISTTAPTGVVEGIEFWLTEDDEQADDALRSYTLIGIKKPVGGGVYTSGTTVILEYDQLQATNFYIKTRGFNATTVGGFSDPSGLIEYTPTQVTNAIDANTQAFDSTGGLLGAIALIDLLGKVSDLFPSGQGTKSLFDRIFEVFNDETGVDLVGQASEGTLVVASELAVKEEGTNVTTNTASINFVGDNVTATATGNDVTVTINNTGSIDDLSDVDTTTVAPQTGDLLKYDGTNWVPTSLNDILPASVKASSTESVLTYYQPIGGIAQTVAGAIQGPSSAYQILGSDIASLCIHSSDYLLLKSSSLIPKGSLVSPGTRTFNIQISDCYAALGDSNARWRWQLTTRNTSDFILTRAGVNPNWVNAQSTTSPYDGSIRLYYTIATYNPTSFFDLTWSNWTLLSTNQGQGINPDGSQSYSGSQTMNAFSCPPEGGTSAVNSALNNVDGQTNVRQVRMNNSFTLNVPENSYVLFGFSNFALNGTAFKNNTIYTNSNYTQNFFYNTNQSYTSASTSGFINGNTISTLFSPNTIKWSAIAERTYDRHSLDSSISDSFSTSGNSYNSGTTLNSFWPTNWDWLLNNTSGTNQGGAIHWLNRARQHNVGIPGCPKVVVRLLN
jgi:hypothetical protein